MPVQSEVSIGRHCGIPDNMAVSDGVHLLVPFAACPGQACAQALQGLALPNLQRLARRLGVEATDAGDPASLSPPHERVLARAHRLDAAPDGLIPLAALQVQQSGSGDPEAGWAWVQPAHWRVGADHIAMAQPRDLQLGEEDARALLEAMRPWFAEDGITLAYDTPLRWLAQGEIFRSLPTASLDRVAGGAIDRWLPSGGGSGRTVRRLQQEMQMLLYTLPLNDARQRRGLLPVNSFWVSGSGSLAPGPHAAPGLQVVPALRDAALEGDWAAWAAAWQQLDAQECARLLAELDRGRTVRLTLCGEAGARTWSSTIAIGARRRLTQMFAAPTAARLLEGL